MYRPPPPLPRAASALLRIPYGRLRIGCSADELAVPGEREDNAVMDLGLQLAGTLLIVLAIVDLYITVLYIRGDMVLLTRRINRLIWRSLAALNGFRRGTGSWALSFVGPLLMIIDISIWGLLLLVGFALVIWPALGSGVTVHGKEPTPTDFVTALYYAGYSLTTLGTGDLVPQTALFRILMILKAALGFSFITLSLTYLVSVYDTLRRRDAFARWLHHSTSSTGDASVWLAESLRAPVPAAVHQNLAAMSSTLDQRFEDHHFYPILHYYRFHERHYAMGRILYVSLDTATLIQNLLDEREYPWLVNSAATKTLWEAGCTTSKLLAEDFLPPRLRPRVEAPDHAELELWEQHFEASLARLRQAEVACRQDTDAAFVDYVQQRYQWDTTVRQFALFMQYDWADIASTATPPARG